VARRPGDRPPLLYWPVFSPALEAPCMSRLFEFIGRHPLIVAGLVAAWLAVLFYELWLRSRGLTHVSTADAVRLINRGALVIDVRQPEAFETGHIVNARNVALEKLGEDSPISKKKDKILLTVCDNGSASGRAASVLRKAGFQNVFSLKGGLTGWRADNLPLVK
jgi:rhodanese-related sulfurtransferase